MKRAFISSALVLIAFCSVAYGWWASRPNLGTVSKQKETTSVQGEQTSSSSVSAAFFSAPISPNYRLRTTKETPDEAIKGQYLLSSTDPALDKQIGITIGAMESDIRSVSPAQLRLLKPDVYQTYDAPYLPEGSIAFRNGSSEIAVLWPNRTGTLYAAVVFTGTVSRGTETANDLAALLNGWQWTE